MAGGMSYHKLTEDSGSSDEARRAEMTKLVSLISDYSEQLSSAEAKFIEQMEDESVSVSTKQLFWARDIWGRFA
jgi:hypothetical protein